MVAGWTERERRIADLGRRAWLDERRGWAPDGAAEPGPGRPAESSGRPAVVRAIAAVGGWFARPVLPLLRRGGDREGTGRLGDADVAVMPGGAAPNP